MHLSEAQIQRLLHGELDAASREAAARHASECPSCDRALAEARREEEEIFGLLEHIDHRTPVIDAASIAPPVRGRTPAWARRAAGIVVVASLAGAAYAIPGSPLPALVKRLVSTMTGERTLPPAGGDVPTPATPATSGIAVPAGMSLVIQFAKVQDAGGVTVSLTDDEMVRVRVTGGTASFTTDVERLDIANHGSSADYEIEIPRDAPRVEIRVSGELRFLKHPDGVRTNAPVDPQGRYRLPLSAPTR